MTFDYHQTHLILGALFGSDVSRKILDYHWVLNKVESLTHTKFDERKRMEIMIHFKNRRHLTSVTNLSITDKKKLLKQIKEVQRYIQGNPHRYRFNDDTLLDIIDLLTVNEILLLMLVPNQVTFNFLLDLNTIHSPMFTLSLS